MSPALLDRLVARPVRMAMGGRLRLAISDGAPLNPAIARDFIALGVNILQGYGLAETSPVVSVNLEHDNHPETVGDPLFEQMMIIGEGRPYLAALVVLNLKGWVGLAASLGIDPEQAGALADARIEPLLLQRIAKRRHSFPGYARVRRVRAGLQPWEIADGLMTATMKLRRRQIMERFAVTIEELYSGTHDEGF